MFVGDVTIRNLQDNIDLWLDFLNILYVHDISLDFLNNIFRKSLPKSHSRVR